MERHAPFRGHCGAWGPSAAREVAHPSWARPQPPPADEPSAGSEPLPLNSIREAPIIIGGAAGLAFALGSFIPLTAVLLTPDSVRPEATAFAAVVGLVATSLFMSSMGVRRFARTLRRALLVGVLAAGLSLLAGWAMQP